MSDPSEIERYYAQRKLFTLEEANAALPLVRAIAKDLAHLSREVLERRERLALLRARRPAEEQNPYAEELAHIEEDLAEDGKRLEEYVEELRELGVEPKNALEGLVDFPARLDGRIVYLCWKLGEPEVLFWHDIEVGFAGRQPLVAGAASGPAEGANPPESQKH